MFCLFIMFSHRRTHLNQWYIILYTKFAFFKIHCNAAMHFRMHFTDNSKGVTGSNIVYFTKLKNLHPLCPNNTFKPECTFQDKDILKFSSPPFDASYSPLPSQAIYILNPCKSNFVQKKFLSFLIDDDFWQFFLSWIPTSSDKTNFVTNQALKVHCRPK